MNRDDTPVAADDALFAAARRRGDDARSLILANEGPPLGLAEVASLLGIPADRVERWRIDGKIVGLPAESGACVYPRWQFDLAARSVLSGLASVLHELRVHDSWMRAAFFLRPNVRLHGARPLDALRGGDLEGVRRAAGAYGEQGAA